MIIWGALVAPPTVASQVMDGESRAELAAVQRLRYVSTGESRVTVMVRESGMPGRLTA